MSPGRTSAVNVVDYAGPHPVVGVVAKRTYSVNGGLVRLADEQLPLVEEPRLQPTSELLEADIDVMLRRPLVDVIVKGHAYAPSAKATRFTAGLRVGALSRKFIVTGARRVERDMMGELRFTPAEPIAKVPLSWELAYGGADGAFARRHLDVEATLAALRLTKMVPSAKTVEDALCGYPRNPAGRGYLLEATPESLERFELPQIEEAFEPLIPETLVRKSPDYWPTAPLPAVTGFLPYVFFPRSLDCGLPAMPYDLDSVRPEHFPEVRLGLVSPRAVQVGMHASERVSLQAGQSAAPGMRLPKLLPGERIALESLHPQNRAWEFTLPAERPRLIYRRPGNAAVEVEAQIRMLLIEPDESRMTVVWTGEAQEAALSEQQFLQIEHAVLWT
ncbi:MAG TPA: DUF2169 domain-containing protein [Polyangiaceae bacterium]|nr:DUF2169 domain-containing protein [Polyangiaceae bacterium]